jgi:sulfatase modifying factor 1
MNLTSQYIVNPKSKDVYLDINPFLNTIRTISTKLRIGVDRHILHEKNKPNTYKLDDIAFKMIRCPSGKFIMGEDDVDNSRRLVEVKEPFLLGETEITQELFERVMGYNPSKFQGDKYLDSKQNPVNQVTWYDAIIFCNKLSRLLRKRPYYNISRIKYGMLQNTKNNIVYAEVTIKPNSNGVRLPTEAEWEYASKAGTNNRWAGTDNEYDVEEVAWFEDNSSIAGEKQTHTVKGKRPNEWGFYDMSGNVREWCWNKYLDTNRVAHGGDWDSSLDNIKVSERQGAGPGNKDQANGFRIALSLVK